MLARTLGREFPQVNYVIYEDIDINDDEANYLDLPSKFRVNDPKDIHNVKVHAEVMVSNIRWNLRRQLNNKDLTDDEIQCQQIQEQQNRHPDNRTHITVDTETFQ